MRIVTYCFMILVILFGISFACLNAEVVSIDIYITQFNLPLSLLLVAVLGIGIVIGIMLITIKYVYLKSENIKLKHKIKWVEKEVTNLRSIPLKDEH